MTAEARQDDRVALAKRFLATLAAMDFDGLGELVDDGAVIEFPFSAAANLDVRGRTAMIERLRAGVTGFLKSIAFEVTAAYPGEDPEVVILEYASQGVRQTGQPYANRYVGVFRVRAGRIVLFREYFNPLATAPAS